MNVIHYMLFRFWSFMADHAPVPARWAYPSQRYFLERTERYLPHWLDNGGVRDDIRDV